MIIKQLSIFVENKEGRLSEITQTLADNNWMIRKALGTRVRNQLRIVPELAFYLDDSLEYISEIDKLLKK